MVPDRNGETPSKGVGHVMRFKLIENWRTELHRLWSIRLSIALAVFTGTAAVISAFSDVFNPWFLLSLSIAVNLVILPLSRLVEQKKPGAPDVQG